MDDDAVLRAAAFCQQPAKRVAALVRQMLLPQQRVAECQPGRDAVFPQQGHHRLGITLPAGKASPAPEAVFRGTVDGTDLAPIVKILPVCPEQRQEPAVQLVKLKQPREMIDRSVSHSVFRTPFAFRFGSFGFCLSRCDVPVENRPCGFLIGAYYKKARAQRNCQQRHQGDPHGRCIGESCHDP